VVLALLLARLAVRDSIGETLFSEMLKAGIIGRELTVEILDCVP
jgi:hypothetical protein